MNKQRLFELISSPANLRYDTDMPMVKELIEIFPYFPTPYIMLTKMLHDDNSIYFDKNLKLGAAYIGDRELLYHYLKDKPVIKDEIEKAPEQIINIRENTLNEEAKVQTNEIEIIEEFKPEEALIESIENDEQIQEFVPAEISKEEVSFDNKSDLAVREEYSEQENKIPDKEIFSYTAYDYLGQFYKNENKSNQEINKIEPEQQKIEDYILAPHKFSEWFDLLEKRKNKSIEKSKSDMDDSKKDDQNIEVKQLIDNFIKTEPRIKPQQTKMYNPEDMAKQSAKQDLSLATETLANIFHKQGLNNKAIEIFQHLILRYPQKSAYFAAKIREIESESKS